MIKYKVVEDLRNYNSVLLDKLLSNETFVKTYTNSVNGKVILKLNEFIDFFMYSEHFQNNYTKYLNIIGLTSENKYLEYNSDVVLNFPYKDCILEGGKTKEEEEKNEIYYHQIIARDEIDVMLSPKVFTKVKKYEDKNETNVDSFTDDDNILIKGNNLIALHSLKERFAGKIKLIYIDPPFNTKSNRFGYNDTFTRSTWLTFMKNRLEVAKELLADDGSIFVHIDHNQSHYLKIIMDEIFEESKFMNEIIWRYRTYIGQVKDYYPKKHDSIFWYMNKKRPKFNMRNVGNYEDTPDYKRWKSFLNEQGEIVYPHYPESDSRFTAYLRRYTKQYGNPEFGDVIYKNEGYVIDDVWEDIIALDAKNKSERIKDFSGYGQKPEALLERIIDSVTEEGDIVLDFFMGSGTTPAVALKMNRRFIGIEQMDYFESVSVNRLKDVVDGERGGISHNQNWKGGGSFIYAELFRLNDLHIEGIINSKNRNDLIDVFNKMKKKATLNYLVDLQKLDIQNSQLSLKDIKNILISSLDMNQQYLSYSEILDNEYEVNEETLRFNLSFYNRNGTENE